MGVCDLCGNSYDKTFTITTTEGESRTFDSFECAIHVVAPACEHCGCKIIGHGVESNGRYFCCANCAGRAGVEGLKDRVD